MNMILFSFIGFTGSCTFTTPLQRIGVSFYIIYYCMVTSPYNKPFLLLDDYQCYVKFY